MAENKRWWESGVIYQIYPRSFVDSNGDGVGDLPGITGRLDYLEWLGVDAIWLSPLYPSPMADFGYDVSDYTDVHPDYGTLEDFDELVAAAHGRGMKVVLDYVPNHTSVEHPWFEKSRSSRESDKRDWYLWRDPAPDGGPPNNWLSHFGGPAWSYDAASGQYYYHAYLPEQPDLNWRNPQVQESMLDVLRFWLARGVDGFRVDALRNLVKDEQFRDNPQNPDYFPDQGPYNTLLPTRSADQPEVHEVVAAMRDALDEYDECLLIGELYVPVETLVTYYASGCDLPFNFNLITTEWNAEKLGELIDRYEAALPEGGWPNWVLGNHDNSRVATRIGPEAARTAAMLLLTLRGTPTLYYGDELGMLDVDIPPDMTRDPFERNVPGMGMGRDPERTPMQWDTRRNAGFTTGEPWLPISADYLRDNVQTQSDDPASLLSLCKSLIDLRRQKTALFSGSYSRAQAGEDLLAYTRERDGQRFLILLNFNLPDRTCDLSTSSLSGEIVLSTDPERELRKIDGEVQLGGYEGVIVELS